MICPVAKCKKQEGPCLCEKVMAVVLGAAVFFFSGERPTVATTVRLPFRVADPRVSTSSGRASSQ